MSASIYLIVAVVTSLKLMLIPSYHSTDFEVHRNWLAITHSLPVNKWYYENTSEWTLDYPPFFAWFEYGLSTVATHVDREMVNVTNLNYASERTVLFQRLSVILTDILYIYAVKQFCNKCIRCKKLDPASSNDIFDLPNVVMAMLLIGNFGLLIVDHIHFQYNGFLTGMLLLSIVRIYESRNIEAALWFAMLLNFKHIYLYLAPAYFVYLLRSYCFKNKPEGKVCSWLSMSLLRLMLLGLAVVSVFAISFGPFINMGQTTQIIARLFPFKRGLCHAYWAPNFWALYNVADKAASIIGSRFGLISVDKVGGAVMTGGLVQEFQHTVLPSITPAITAIITVVSILPALIHQWCSPRGPVDFLRCLILCAFGCFMFGWHVHEKAILLVLIPMTLLVFEKRADAQNFLILSTVGHYSLFPLLFTQFETPIKICMLLIYTIYAFTAIKQVYGTHGTLTRLPVLTKLESIYLVGIIPLEIYNSLVHSMFTVTARLTFLPLLLTSCYCAIGVFYCWLRFYCLTLRSEKSNSRVNSTKKLKQK